MITRKLSLLFSLCLLTGCVAETQLTQDTNSEPPVKKKEGVNQPELTEQQKAIDARYTQALAKWQEKMQPINEHIVNTCRPKNDRKYIKCINEKNKEIIEASFLPELTIQMLNARREFEQQLIQKKITRKEFMDYAERLKNDMLYKTTEQAEKDVMAGTYSAKY